MKVLSVVGARPQFIKEGPVGRAIRKRHEEVLVHTGQHYDPEMSDVFFRDLDIPAPDHHLGVGSGSHGAQTGAILEKMEPILQKEKPDWVLVYGDTNSTLAGALAAAKLHVPVAHVEAGLRSFDRRMPEEVNRIVADHVSDLLLAPTPAAVKQLGVEGLASRTLLVGDVMVESLAHGRARAKKTSKALATYGLKRDGFVLLTLHRPANVDDPAALKRILGAVAKSDRPVAFPVHPRTRERMVAAGLKVDENVRLLPPQGYLDFLALEEAAHRILTDSGGVQKEAYLLGVPCITLRETTEWRETVDDGWNTLVGSDPKKIAHALKTFRPSKKRTDRYGKGDASAKIVKALEAGRP